MRAYFFFASFIITVTYTFAVPKHNKDINYANRKDYKLCTTNDCMDTASKIAAKLDRTIDPCDNFYKFACGGWMADHPVNESYPITNSLKMISEKTTEQIAEILESSSRPDDTFSLNKAKKLYAMCMDVKKLEDIGINSLIKIVQKNGGWPMAMSIKEWQMKRYTWQQISNFMHNNMFDNGLYDIIVEVDHKESNKHVIFITEPSFVALRDIVIDMNQNPEKKSIYKSLIKEVVRMFVNEKGTYINNTTIAQDVDDVVDLEIEMAKVFIEINISRMNSATAKTLQELFRTLTKYYIYPDQDNWSWLHFYQHLPKLLSATFSYVLTLNNEDRRDIDKIYNELTVAELQRAYDTQRLSSKSKINWHNNLQQLFGREKIMIQPREKIVVQGYKYLMSLIQLLEKTSSRTIVNYMQWTLIRNLLRYSGKHMEKIAFEISKQFHSQPADNSRWKICAQGMNLDTAISHAYAKRYVQHENVEDINNIIQDVANVIRGQISASTWMDEVTKKASLEKLASIKNQVSTPDWYSNKNIDKYYNGLIITSNYLESIRNLQKYETKRMFRKLRKPVDKNDWEIQPTIVNAFYNPSNNAIVLTAGILQDPVYNRNRLPFINYASLGFVIGHEINHGFDNFGRKYDKNGNSIQWWTQETIDKYEQLTECFVDQYNSYRVPGLDSVVHVNGRLTLGENIGDSAGITAAYNAYRNRKANLDEPEMRLPGLEDYTNDQIFFMNAAHTFCENATPEKIKLLLLNEHPRPEIRIRGSLSNFDEFSMAFNCPVGLGMNPEKKCVLWQ